MKQLLLAFLLLTLTACAADSSGEPIVLSGEGSSLLAQATVVAARALSEHKTATIQSATISAGATNDTILRASTATAQAQQVHQTDIASNATSNALAVEQEQTRQSSTGTTEALRSLATQTTASEFLSATATAEQRSADRFASRTAAAVVATSTAYAATSTRSSQDMAAALEHLQATATVEALNRQRIQSEQDAVRWTQWNEFFQSLLLFFFAVAGIALLVLGIIFFARYLDTRVMRSMLLETRAGTVMITYQNGQAFAQLVTAPQSLLEAGDEFAASDAEILDHEADPLKITQGKRETFIAKTDPAEDARQARQMLAMRLLRESISYYNARNEDARTINRIPSFRDLQWSSETWVRAVESLKPHIFTKRGREGGTFCGDQYPTLMQLYSALGEHRISLGVPAPIPQPELAPTALSQTETAQAA